METIAKSDPPANPAHPLGKTSDEDGAPDFDIATTPPPPPDPPSSQSQSSGQPQSGPQAPPMYQSANPTKQPFTYFYAVSHYGCRVDRKETMRLDIFAEVYGVCEADASDENSLKAIKLAPMLDNRWPNDQIAKVKCSPGEPVYKFAETSEPYSFSDRDAAEQKRAQDIKSDIAAGIMVESQSPSPHYASNCQQ